MRRFIPLKLLDHASRRRLLPHLVALPLSEKENRHLSASEVMKREVGRVLTSWGTRTCLWDPRYLIFDEADTTTDTRFLQHILEQFASFGAQIIPVIQLREKYHRLRTLSEHSSRTGSGIAVRLSSDDVQEYDLLEAQLAASGIDAKDCILIIDISESDISEHEQFSEALVGWIYALRNRANWAKIVLVGSSYPLKNPAAPEGHVDSPRHEWQLWDWLLKTDPAVRNFVIFGDFGADNAAFKFGGGGRPIPHLRYLDREYWHVSRGTKEYASIRNVAQQLTRLMIFKGRDFSAGDEFIVDCAAGIVGTSDPTQWPAVNMNHHLTATIHHLAAMYGIKLPPRRAFNPEQPSLFSIKVK